MIHSISSFDAALTARGFAAVTTIITHCSEVVKRLGVRVIGLRLVATVRATVMIRVNL